MGGTATAPATATACVTCGSSELRPHLKVAGAMGEQGLIPTTDAFGTALSDIVRCGACGHMQLERMPEDAELEEAYADAESTAYVEEEAGQRATAAAILDVIEQQVPRGRLLDIGCWVGFLPSEAAGRGWEAVGIEPSEFASRYAREELGLDVRTEELFTADLPLESFDAVVLGDVIEHLPDPGAALDRIHALLAPGGVVALMLPDAGSRLARMMGARWWSVIPTHVQYFTRSSLSRLVERHGFEVRHVGTSPKAFTVRYYLDRIGGYSQPVGKALVRGAEAVKVADRIWAPDFGDRMLLVAARK